MNPTVKALIRAGLAAAIMAAVESLADGNDSPRVLMLHAGTAAALVVVSYLEQSPLKPRPKKNGGGKWTLRR